MNQKNGKNSLGLDSCFEDLDNPIELFKNWFTKAEEKEINDPNAVAVATSDKHNQPNVRMVLLKGLSDRGFVFYTNFNSKKSEDLKDNKNASMCFHWKSLRRQIRITGKVEKVTDKEADSYFNSRPYKNKIGALMISERGSEDHLSKSSVVGILTERDLVYALSGGANNLESKTVKDVMTRKLIFTCPDTSNSDAKKLMLENQIRHLPVFSGEHLVGIISMRDVFKA